MERDEWVQHCDEVSQLLRQIREQGGLPFTANEESHCQESLDANELRIAFDLLCWKLEETEADFTTTLRSDRRCGIEDGMLSQRMGKLKTFIR
jgi:hypothetical protein